MRRQTKPNEGSSSFALLSILIFAQLIILGTLTFTDAVVPSRPPRVFLPGVQLNDMAGQSGIRRVNGETPHRPRS